MYEERTEARDNETAASTIDFMNNARIFFAAYDITGIERVITDTGSCCRAADFMALLREGRYSRIRPYTRNATAQPHARRKAALRLRIH